MIARPVRFAARAAARWTRSSAAETHGLSVPISPMIPGSDAALADPVGCLAHELVGEVVDGAPVDQRLGRVVRAAVPAGAHHDVQPRRACQPGEPHRIASDPGRREVDEAASPGGPEAFELGEDHRLVARQLPVVPARLDVPQGNLGVLVRQRDAELGWVDSPEDRLDVAHRGMLPRR